MYSFEIINQNLASVFNQFSFNIQFTKWQYNYMTFATMRGILKLNTISHYHFLAGYHILVGG